CLNSASWSLRPRLFHLSSTRTSSSFHACFLIQASTTFSEVASSGLPLELFLRRMNAASAFNRFGWESSSFISLRYGSRLAQYSTASFLSRFQASSPSFSLESGGSRNSLFSHLSDD